MRASTDRANDRPKVMKRYGVLAQLVVGVTAFGLTVFVIGLVFFVRQGDSTQPARSTSTRSGNIEFAITPEGTIGSGPVGRSSDGDDGQAPQDAPTVAIDDPPSGDFDPSPDAPTDDTVGTLDPELAAVLGSDSPEELLSPVTEKLPEITLLR